MPTSNTDQNPEIIWSNSEFQIKSFLYKIWFNSEKKCAGETQIQAALSILTLSNRQTKISCQRNNKVCKNIQLDTLWNNIYTTVAKLNNNIEIFVIASREVCGENLRIFFVKCLLELLTWVFYDSLGQTFDATVRSWQDSYSLKFF